MTRLHRRISGTAPNGLPYKATDPALAVWTHVTIYSGFLEGHLRYAPNPISGAQIDRYWDEVAQVPELLGARAVPRSRYEVEDYFRRIRPELSASRDALDSARWVLEGGKGSSPTVRDAAQALVKAWSEALPAHPFLVQKVLPEASAAAVRLAYGIFARAAVDLLPDWGRRMLRLKRSPVAYPLTRAYFGSLRLAAPTVPRALREARARAAGETAIGSP